MPRLPPDKISVIWFPGHIDDEVKETEPAGWEFMFTTTVVLAHEVESHVPSALK